MGRSGLLQALGWGPGTGLADNFVHSFTNDVW
jgi:hypothetical protein